MIKDDFESNAGVLLAGAFMGAVMLAIDWLLAKPLLHGQLKWLVWLPLATAVIFALVARMPDRVSEWLLIALFLGGVCGAPAVAKVLQLQAEERYADAVQRIYSGTPKSVSRDDLIKAGWEICDGLDAVHDAGDGKFSAADPARTVARFVITGTPEPAEGEERMVRVVHAADRILC